MHFAETVDTKVFFLFFGEGIFFCKVIDYLHSDFDPLQNTQVTIETLTNISFS